MLLTAISPGTLPAGPPPPLAPSPQGLQGGPHNHTISALAVALKMARTEEFRSYQQQVVANCAALCRRLQAHGYKVVSDGTDNHLVLVDLKPAGIDGARVQTLLDQVGRWRGAGCAGVVGLTGGAAGWHSRMGGPCGGNSACQLVRPVVPSHLARATNMLCGQRVNGCLRPNQQLYCNPVSRCPSRLTRTLFPATSPPWCPAASASARPR